MANIENDILRLIEIVEQKFERLGRYVQALDTPPWLPKTNDVLITPIAVMGKPADETVSISFSPPDGWRVRVNVWYQGHRKAPSAKGFFVTAEQQTDDKWVRTVDVHDNGKVVERLALLGEEIYG